MRNLPSYFTRCTVWVIKKNPATPDDVMILIHPSTADCLQQTVERMPAAECLNYITLSHVIIVPAPFKWATPVPIPYWANCIRIENKNWTNTKIMIRADMTHVVDIEVDHHGPGKKCPNLVIFGLLIRAVAKGFTIPDCHGRRHHSQ